MIEWLDAGTIELFQPLHNPVLTVIMKFFTTIGEGGAVWILAAVLLLLFKKTRKAGIILAGALVLCLLSCNIALKNLVARPRPCWRREDLEMLILPGGLGGVEKIQKSLAAQGMIQRAAEEGAYVAAICAAPTILAHLTLLDRRKAVCYPGMEDQMYSAVVQKGEHVVVDGRFITGEAAGSVFEFGLKLVEVLRGKEAADQVKHSVHYHYGS